MASPTTIAAYLLLFAGAAGVFVLVNITLGRFLRPHVPSVEKGEVYECGEPVIGSSFVQFDIRFYVVALLFIIFDVEVAFFFPWAVAFGKVTQVSAAAEAVGRATGDAADAWRGELATRLAELGLAELRLPAGEGLADAPAEATAAAARLLGWGLFAEIAVFFAILMVGFAYVWRRGDLDWVRTSGVAAATVSRPIQPPQAA